MLSQPLFQPQPFVNGQWALLASQKTFDVTDPATGTVICTLPDQTADEIQAAIDVTATAFRTYRKTTAAQRAEWLRNLYNLMIEHLDDLARLITWENGKCLADALGEAKYAALYFDWFAGEARRNEGHTIRPGNGNNRVMTFREPVGPVGLLCPYNFPSAMGARKAAPALAAGCTCVLKPDGQTPLSLLAIAALAKQAGFPDGVLNVVTVSTESTPACGLMFCELPKLRKISFTGLTAVGKLLMRQSSQTLKKLSMELGGNAPVVVFDDADLDLAVEHTIASKFRSLGQTCVCANRLYVQAGIHDRFVEKLAEKVRQFKIGNGFAEGVTHACLTNVRLMDKVEAHVEDAIGRGARVVVKGGPRPDLGPNFYLPYVLDNVSCDSRVCREETFGPLAAIVRFGTQEEVLAQCNDTEFGLAAYVFSENLNTCLQMSEALEVGMVSVNTGLFTDSAVPFGGVKESGFGREGLLYGLDDYTVVKCVTLGNVHR